MTYSVKLKLEMTESIFMWMVSVLFHSSSNNVCWLNTLNTHFST